MGKDGRIGERELTWTHALALTLALSCSGCCSGGDVWSFGLSRELYADANSHRSPAQDRHRENLAGREAMAPEFGAVILVIFAAPLLVDIVFLPVAGLHDVFQPALCRKSDDAADAGQPRTPLPPPYAKSDSGGSATAR